VTDGDAAVRAVAVAPASARRVSAFDLNIITERREDQRFDLIVATNVLVYYDAFQQALAFANAAAMLRPGGLFLTNDARPAVDGMRLKHGGSQPVVYAKDNVGDRIDWYLK
jgi:predicted TPR repeat methyltransferase